MNFDVTEYATPNVDITDSLTDVLGLILSVFKSCFNFLKGIEFFGTNLLNVSISFVIVAAVFPIIFSLVSSRSANAGAEAISRAKKSHADRKAKKNDKQIYMEGF